MDLYNVLILLVFIAVVLAIEGAYLLWSSYKGPEASKIERRLSIMSAGAHGSADTSLLKQRLLSDTPFVEHALLSIPRIHVLDRLLVQSGLQIKLATFLGISLACAVAGYIAANFLVLPLIVIIATGIFAGCLPYFYLLYRKDKRLKRFDEQLPDALDLIGRGIRAGNSLPATLKMIGDEMADPVAGEFRIAFDEVNYGFSMQDALTNLTTRVPSSDLKYFVVAVIIQRETGGNLAELLDNIAALIRSRHKLYGSIRVLSAEGKLSAWILTLLPISVALLINIINPKFMQVLWTDNTGIKMIIGVVIMMIIGIFWMRKIIKIRV
jgi:tight adherence protein B